MKLITLIFAMFIAFNANAQINFKTDKHKMLTDTVEPFYTTGVDYSNWVIHPSKSPTTALVIDNNGRTVASIDTSGILTVIDSLATIKAFFSAYGFKINGYKQKYYYNWAYQTDSTIIIGSDFIQAPSRPTKNYIIKHTHLFDTLDKDKLLIDITPIKNPAD